MWILGIQTRWCRPIYQIRTILFQKNAPKIFLITDDERDSSRNRIREVPHIQNKMQLLCVIINVFVWPMRHYGSLILLHNRTEDGVRTFWKLDNVAMQMRDDFRETTCTVTHDCMQSQPVRKKLVDKWRTNWSSSVCALKYVNNCNRK